MHPLLYEQINNRDVSSAQAHIDLVRLHNEAQFSRLTNKTEISPLIFPEQSHNAPVNTLALEKQSHRYLLSGAGDSCIKLWDLEQEIDESAREHGRFVPAHVIGPKRAHQFGITNIQWWPTDTDMFVSSSYDNTLKLFDTSTMEVAHSFDLGSRVQNFDIPPDGSNSLVACCCAGGTGGLKLVDLRTLADSHILGGGGKLNGGVGFALSCAFSPTEPNLLVSGGQDGSCIGWDIRRSNGILFKLDSNMTVNNYKSVHATNNTKAHDGGINSLLFNDLGTELITAGNDDKIKVWNLTTHSQPLNKLINFGPLVRNKNKAHLTMCLSPSVESEIQYLWFPSDSGEILVYNVNDGRLNTRLSRSRDTSVKRATSVVYRGECTSEYYSGAIDGTITIWGAAGNQGDNIKEMEFDNGVDYPDEATEDANTEERNVLDRIQDEMDANRIMKENGLL